MNGPNTAFADITESQAREKRRRFLSPSLASFQAYEEPLLLHRGYMQHVWGGDGRKYLDLVGQNVSISVGHCHPVVNDAVHRQIDEMVHCTTMWMHPAAGEYAEELIARLPEGNDWVAHFVNSGAEAMDLAMLLARVGTGNTDLISLRNSFHGTHFGTAALSGLADCHQPSIAAPGIIHVTGPGEYRGIHGAGSAPYLAELDATLESSTDGSVAGFVFEAIQGFGGVTPIASEYLTGAAERIRARGGVIVADEVQTGFGRTGDHFWGFEEAGLIPDIVVMGKGIGNGFPLAAVVCRREIAASISGRKFFNTYGSNPVACAAGRAVLSVIESEGLQRRSAELGPVLMESIAGQTDRFEFIGDIRGSGLLIGVDIVADRESKEPSSEIAARIQERLRDEGMIIGRGGAAGNVLRIVPPMCIEAADCELFADAFERACTGI